MPITTEFIRLSNGVHMPKLGLGTYQMTHDQVRVAVPAALDAGYRLIDTATIYKNEDAIGAVLADRKIRRSELFIESKLSSHDQGYERCLQAVDASLGRLRIDYIDLYIVHWPGASGLDPSAPDNGQLRRGSWKALETCYRQGKCKAIGVSNYTEKHLQEMKEYADILPMVNQIELHPSYFPEATVKWCRDNGVAVQAYSSLARGRLLRPEALEKSTVLAAAADRHQKSVSQVLLRWAWQHGFAIIPKSVSPDRIRANADIDFALSEDEMGQMDRIHVEDPCKICWDPEGVL